MKKLIYTLFLFAFSVSLNAQWQSDVRLTNDGSPSLFTINRRCVASSGDTIIAVWRSPRSGSGEIACIRSVNGGLTWSNIEKIAGANGLELSSPSITVYQNVFYVIYKQNSFSIQLSKSTNAGLSWIGKTVQQGSDMLHRYDPCIAVSGNNIHAAWITDVNGFDNLNYRRSTNGGDSFSDLYTWLPIGNNSISDAALAVNESTVLFVYGTGMPAKLHYSRSTDNGASWLALNITPGSDIESSPSAFANGQNFYVAWADSRNGNSDIYCRRSTNNCNTWLTETRLTTHISSQNYPSIFVSGSNVHLTWVDFRDSSEIYYLKGINNGNSWQTAVRLTDNVFSSLYPSVTAAGQKVHIVWSDRRFDNRHEIFYKQNLTGNVGINSISTEIPSAYSLGQNYPNPFNPTTVIRFSIPSLSFQHASSWNPVLLKVYDLMGREVQTLVNEQLAPGTYETTFDGTALSSGTYFYKLTSGNFSQTKKLTLLK